MRAAMLVLMGCVEVEDGKLPEDPDVVGVDSEPGVVDTDAPPDTDVVDTDAPPDTDAVDTDGEPVDSAAPVDTVVIDTGPPPPVDTGPFGVAVIDITATADDVWELTVDGVPYLLPASAADWRTATTLRLELPGRRHVLAFKAWDMHQSLTGFLARVDVSGDFTAVTGGARFRVTGTEPPPEWVLKRYDDSAWDLGGACTFNEVESWGYRFPDIVALQAQGAQWVWGKPCGELGESWFRVRIGPEP